MIGYIFCHGWGLDPTFFNLLRPHFRDHPTLFWNLGYFREKYCPLPSNDAETWVGIGHSFGFAKLLQAGIPLKGLVGLQAFVSFLGKGEEINAKRSLELKAFEKKFNTSAHSVLTHIQQACGMEPIQAVPQLEHLVTDLASLRRDYSYLLSPAIPTLIVGNADDTVVPPSLIQDNFQGYPQTRFLFYNEGGHRLSPISAPLIAHQIHCFTREL
jgi:pimeloyl-[acyl-carrier protein] methyl ester esterase